MKERSTTRSDGSPWLRSHQMHAPCWRVCTPPPGHGGHEIIDLPFTSTYDPMAPTSPPRSAIVVGQARASETPIEKIGGHRRCDDDRFHADDRDRPGRG